MRWITSQIGTSNVSTVQQRSVKSWTAWFYCWLPDARTARITMRVSKDSPIVLLAIFSLSLVGLPSVLKDLRCRTNMMECSSQVANLNAQCAHRTIGRFERFSRSRQTMLTTLYWPLNYMKRQENVSKGPVGRQYYWRIELSIISPSTVIKSIQQCRFRNRVSNCRNELFTFKSGFL